MNVWLSKYYHDLSCMVHDLMIWGYMTKRKPPCFKWDFAVEIQQSRGDVRVNDSIIAGMEGILPK